MEDILAIVLVFAGVALVTLAIRWFVRRSTEKREEAYRETQRQIEATRVWRESMRSKTIATVHKNTPPSKKENKQYTPSSTTATTSSSTDDNFFSGMVTGMLIDNVVNSITHKSESSVGVSKSESSWGFDDNDSRKSISSSMDTSSSWSSSDSSSSSSDSGPSSDW